MRSSKRIAGLLGPTMAAVLVSEFPLVQPHLYDAQIPPVVYLSGVMMLVGATLLIVNWHPHWGAALIILFLVPTAFLMHNYWSVADPMARASDSAHFWKNLTIAFALLLYIVQGHLYTVAH